MIDDDLSAGPGGLASTFCALDVLVETGQWARAAALANQVEEEVARRGAAYPSTPWRIAAAHAHTALRDDERARALIAAQRPITDLWDTPRLHATTTLRAEARILAADEAVDRLRSAIEHVAGSPSRLELARSLVALGELLRRGGQRVECREPLREGLELAQRCGALPLAERAATELRATGARAQGAPQRRRIADRQRAADLPSGRGGTDEPRDRPGPLGDAQDRRDALVACLSQARRARPRRAVRSAGWRSRRAGLSAPLIADELELAAQRGALLAQIVDALEDDVRPSSCSTTSNSPHPRPHRAPRKRSDAP